MIRSVGVPDPQPAPAPLSAPTPARPVLRAVTPPPAGDDQPEHVGSDVPRPEFWGERVELAAVFRVAALHGLHEGIDNHCSLAVADDRFLVNPYGPHWSEVTARDLLEVHHDGSVVGDQPLDLTALHIHRSVHRARPDAVCVLHTHMPYATAVACGDDQFVPEVSQNSMRFAGRVAWLGEFAGLANDETEGDRIAAAVADGARVVFLAHHGVIVIGESVPAAWQDLYFLERACMVQILADSAGQLRRVPKRVARLTADQIDEVRTEQSQLLWAAELRRLARQNPGHDT